MELFEGHQALFRPLSAPVVVLGNFDGVHLGHQRLLKEARSLVAPDSELVVYTFEPHPAAFLAPESAPPLLTPLSRKLELLEGEGVDVCVLEPFTGEFSQIHEADFASRVLSESLGAKTVLVGYDFRYGHKAKGTSASLSAHGEKLGFEVQVFPEQRLGGQALSSTEVRRQLHDGKPQAAARLLGRAFDLQGKVIKGAGRGRTIGIPTANIETLRCIRPAPGIYAVLGTLLDEPASKGQGPSIGTKLLGAASLGTNPTFETDHPLSLEIHFLDFRQDIYGRQIRVEFIEFLRGEEKYDSVEALVNQINQDIKDSRAAIQRWQDEHTTKEA